MKLVRRRRPSMKTALGITNAKRSIARATGIPTTKSGRKCKAMNTITGGAYGKYTRARAAVNRPFKRSRRIGCGCLTLILQTAACIAALIILLFM